MNIGERIRQARREKKLNQAELAKKLNISIGSLSHYEANRRTPTPQMLQKIADILDKDISFFFGIDGRGIKDRDKREAYDLVMALSNGDKQMALGCLKMLKEGKGRKKSMEELYNEIMGTVKLTKENELMIRRMLMLVKVSGQEKLEAILKLLK